jgi:hypothetical protein
MIEDRNRPVTLDALLKLKRAEKPSPEFWLQFERELHEKQLAAIVEKRPWWCAVPRVYVFAVRHRMPLAALSSSVALALVGFNAYQVFAPGASQGSGIAPAAFAAEPAATVAVADSVSAPLATPALRASPRATPVAARAVAATSDALPAIPMLGDLPPSSATERFDSLSHSLSGELALADAPGTLTGRTLLMGGREFGPRAMPARTAVSEPLAQMQAPSEEHRSRLLAEVYPAMAGPSDVVAPASERVLGRLSDDRLYPTGSRYDLSSGTFSIRF